MSAISHPKRLIEVDLPIKAISAHARREKSIRHGHLSTLHMWWARRPLAACRAVLCASLWPDPADENCPQSFRDAAADILREFAESLRSDKKVMELCSSHSSRWQATNASRFRAKDAASWSDMRGALLDFIADFANWDASTVPAFLKTARALTEAAQAEVSGGGSRPLVVDPFAGGGSIPLECLRVGADVAAFDLNPVPVVLNDLLLARIPSAGESLVPLLEKLALRVHEEARRRLALLYPSDEDGSTLIAYLWCRTIRCQGPGCGTTVPLVSSPVLSKRRSRVVGVAFSRSVAGGVCIKISEYRNASEVGPPTVKRGAATCPACGYTTAVEDVRSQLRERRGGALDALLYAKVVKTPAGETKFRSPNAGDGAAYIQAETQFRDHVHSSPGNTLDDLPLPPEGALGFRVQKYGMTSWRDLFTLRQRLLLGTYASLVRELEFDGTESRETFETARLLLGATVSKIASFTSTLCFWRNVRSCVAQTFGRTTQTLAMLWDFGEMNPFAESAGDYSEGVEYLKLLVKHVQSTVRDRGDARLGDARHIALPDASVNLIFTDPPYYDSVPYGHLSEFYLYWLNACGIIDTTPKEIAERRPFECIVDQAMGLTPAHYEQTMAGAMAECARVSEAGALGVVVFAHKSTGGWEAQLQALLDAGWTITASWPIDTERSGRPRANDSAALASSVHLVCRRRGDTALSLTEVGQWRAVLAELPRRIQEWMPRLASEGVVGADAIFACLGPALEVFSRYSKVEKASGERVKLKEYLEQVWAAVSKEALSLMFEDADASGLEEDSRLTAMWLWTLNAGASAARSTVSDGESTDLDEDEEDDAESGGGKLAGFTLEYDTARKIAQGLGAHLEKLSGVVEVRKDKARLLSVAERTKALFGKDGADEPAASRSKTGKLAKKQLGLFREVEAAETAGVLGPTGIARVGATTLDRLHQAMILFAAGRAEVLKRFIVDEGAGKDARFWKLAQSLSALYPPGSDEKRWVDGVLTRKKSLGF